MNKHSYSSVLYVVVIFVFIYFSIMASCYTYNIEFYPVLINLVISIFDKTKDVIDAKLACVNKKESLQKRWS